MKENEQTLYAKGVNGIKVYNIWNESNKIHIVANGAHYTEEILEGKSGRSLDDQIKLRINARVRSKLDNGFVDKLDKVKDTPTNQLGCHLPMLAQRADKVKNFNDKIVYVQPKLDGHRCLKNSDIAYSRGGKEINTVGGLFDSLSLPEGVTLDGELYHHGTPLQTISSWAKRYQSDTEKLQYCIYDIIVEDELDMPFKDRFLALSQIVKQNERIKIVDTSLVPFTEVKNIFNAHRRNGYEGTMIRSQEGKYSIGKRPKDLLKVKHYFDDEFECVDIDKSRDGWGILILKAPNGLTFEATAPGSIYEKEQQYKNKEKYIGKFVTVEYANFTNKGVPFQPVATRWRIDI